MRTSNRAARTLLTACLAAVVATTGAACGLPSEQAAPSSSRAPADLTRSFADEFDGPAGAPPNPEIWTPDVGGTGWGNKELQYYTAGENGALDGEGHLVIEARRDGARYTCWYGPCRYTSAKYVTRRAGTPTFAQRYGRFEARLKFPLGKGFWPAFWLLGTGIDEVGYPRAGEIDVIEALGHQPTLPRTYLHGPELDEGGRVPFSGGWTIADWHTYAVDWTEDEIRWRIDDRVVRVLHRSDVDRGWVFDHPFFLILNMAVGGEWPGSPDDTTEFPARMLVDHVRVSTATEPTPTPTGGDRP